MKVIIASEFSPPFVEISRLRRSEDDDEDEDDDDVDEDEDDDDDDDEDGEDDDDEDDDEEDDDEDDDEAGRRALAALRRLAFLAADSTCFLFLRGFLIFLGG